MLYLVWIHSSSFGTILQEAVTLRQENVLNLMLQKNATTKILANTMFEPSHQKVLHLAATLSPYPELSSVSCLALQMQRELQWFKVRAMHVLLSSYPVLPWIGILFTAWTLSKLYVFAFYASPGCGRVCSSPSQTT